MSVPRPNFGTDEGVAEVLRIAEEAVRRMEWVLDPQPPPEAAEAFAGRTVDGSADGSWGGSWSATLVGWVAGKETRYDGAVMNPGFGLVLHMTPALAKIAVECAHAVPQAVSYTAPGGGGR